MQSLILSVLGNSKGHCQKKKKNVAEYDCSKLTTELLLFKPCLQPNIQSKLSSGNHRGAAAVCKQPQVSLLFSPQLPPRVLSNLVTPEDTVVAVTGGFSSPWTFV